MAGKPARITIELAALKITNHLALKPFFNSHAAAHIKGIHVAPSIAPKCWVCDAKNPVGGGEKGYQLSGREGARCGVTLWPAVGRRKREAADCFLSQAGLSSLLARGVR
jgi:hypothetical protein